HRSWRRFTSNFSPAHEPDFGRDIALRCPRPRISGRHRCAAERGADGAARRTHQDQGFNARSFVSGKSLHEPPLSRPSATLSPPCGERAGRGETRRGSWPQLTSKFWKCSLSMKLPLTLSLSPMGERV